MQLSGPNGRGLDHFPAPDQGSVAGDRDRSPLTTRDPKIHSGTPPVVMTARCAAAETIQTQRIPVTLAERPHPFPSRTRKLSSPAPKILRGQPFGKIGRRRDFCVPAACRASAVRLLLNAPSRPSPG